MGYKVYIENAGMETTINNISATSEDHARLIALNLMRDVARAWGVRGEVNVRLWKCSGLGMREINVYPTTKLMTIVDYMDRCESQMSQHVEVYDYGVHDTVWEGTYENCPMWVFRNEVESWNVRTDGAICFNINLPEKYRSCIK